MEDARYVETDDESLLLSGHGLPHGRLRCLNTVAKPRITTSFTARRFTPPQVLRGGAGDLTDCDPSSAERNSLGDDLLAVLLVPFRVAFLSESGACALESEKIICG